MCLLSYPTPTPLYRVARRIAELTGQWRFPDERLLRLEEITLTVDPYGSLIATHLVWPILFTQQMIAIVRRSGSLGFECGRGHVDRRRYATRESRAMSTGIAPRSQSVTLPR